MNHQSAVRDQFFKDGYALLRSPFSRDEIDFYISQLAKLSVGRGPKWTLPDGVCQHPLFWDVIFNPHILASVRQLLGQNVQFLQHNDLHAGFSSFHWHRDSVCRSFGKGPDWDERAEPYRLVRVGVYLQEPWGGFRLGLIRGSHRPDLHMSDAERDFIERKTGGLTKALTLAGRRDPLEDRADWVAPEPGDCIIFDPRIIHTGSVFKGTKYSFFIAYGVDNNHFRNHFNYYRHLRGDLNYAALHPDLVDRLQAAGLYASEEATAPETIEGAWLPSKVFTVLARPFK
jgi:hypothetical protein